MKRGRERPEGNPMTRPGVFRASAVAAVFGAITVGIAGAGKPALAISGETFAASPVGLKAVRFTTAARLTADEVLVQLGWRGFSGFSKPRLVGRAWQVAATNRRGRRVVVMVDAYSGVVLHPSGAYGSPSFRRIPPKGG
ncbi:hypothetical protein CH339_15930 [Rhodobium orientis]|uniref:PepSY domain-containing protein n=2 Tax=Rhodobium orientis TaxID=34017 RepID=A0A327JRP4_9HYPH|nr:hypothetical protein [Rhodobium orientis]RAI26038.1 hypothetical protein CH339_15930 [Rhodobium orientis]